MPNWTYQDADSADDEQRSPVLYEDLTATPLVDGSALVSFALAPEQTVSTIDSEGNAGPCSRFLSFQYEGSRYGTFAIDYRVLVQAWVPLVATGDPWGRADPGNGPDRLDHHSV